MIPFDNSTPHRALDYDQNVRQAIPFYEIIHGQVLDLVKRAKPAVSCWLDTGCGTGYLVELALSIFPETQFILADPAEAMLQLAQKRLQNVDRRRLSFLSPGGSQDLASHNDDLTPQVITAIQCHHYLRSKERKLAVQSCYRLLQKDGLFITFENIAPQTKRGLAIGLERWQHFQLEQGRSQTTVENHLKRLNVKYFPITVNEHLDLLKAVGFQVVEIFWLSQMQAGFYALK